MAIIHLYDKCMEIRHYIELYQHPAVNIIYLAN